MYSIRYGTVNDAFTIRQIIEKAWLGSNIPAEKKQTIIDSLRSLYPEERIITEIRDRIQYYLLLNEDNLPVAFASYSITDQTPADYRIHKIYSLPELQGKGYMKILITKVQEIAVEKGGQYLYIHLSGHHKQTAYFEALGFQLYDRQAADELILVKPLARE